MLQIKGIIAYSYNLFHLFLISVLLIMILNKTDLKYLCVKKFMFNYIIKIYLK